METRLVKVDLAVCIRVHFITNRK
ncbi:hypothetical protein Pint_26841 [Pistacia integerrima]|uniref:Uncharacterized protein n=1 Tax=Pistacia integerrima TaxID=434235 RepID=A0ACC0YMA6_9ROSI|nr:hypothetical protein Pint_26841 [Pistacia integerrima]